MGSQQFCLRWHNHQSNMLNVFDQLLQNEALVDVTLACDGLSLKAHKVVLSACSPYFQTLFVENPCQHPIVFLKDVRYADLKALVDFMYKGEVNVTQEQLNAVLKTAEALKVKGLAEVIPPGLGGHSAGSGHGSISPVSISDSLRAAALVQSASGLGLLDPHGLIHGSVSFKEGKEGRQQQQQTGLPPSQAQSVSLRTISPSSSSAAVSPSSPPSRPLGSQPTMLPESVRRSGSPPAKRRKAKPRKRAPESAYPHDNDDSDALDLTTVSPELTEGCMDIPDMGYDPTSEAISTMVAAATDRTSLPRHCSSDRAGSSGGTTSLTNASGGSSVGCIQRSMPSFMGLHVDIGEENGAQQDRGDSSSEGTTAQGSPAGAGIVAARAPSIIPKVHPILPTSISMVTTTPPPTPSTSATQASIQDAQPWSERRMRAYHCEHCKMTFESKALLYRHGCPKERVGFTCEECGSSFPSHSRYYRHKQIHNPTRETYTCSLCNKSMVRLDHLKTHLRNVHGIYP